MQRLLDHQHVEEAKTTIAVYSRLHYAVSCTHRALWREQRAPQVEEWGSLGARSCSPQLHPPGPTVLRMRPGADSESL